MVQRIFGVPRFSTDVITAESDSQNGEYQVRETKRVLRFRLMILVGLNLLDCLTTWLIVNSGGIEANPILSWVIVNTDLQSMLLFKAAGGVLIAGLLARPWWDKYALRITWAVTTGLFIVVMNNGIALTVSTLI